MKRVSCVAVLVLAAIAPGAGCSVDADDAQHEQTGTAESAITVAEAADAGCSTIAVKGLSLQIIAQANCIEPGAFLEVPTMPNVSVQDTVFPFLEAPARDAFVTAVMSRPDLSMTLNSMLRTVAQQYLLYRWYQQGTCGISLAATPGSSNHETGLALDISEHGTWRPVLEANGFAWLGSSDPVHFDYAGPGAVDYRGMDVLAFQMLWNLNNPDDPIDEDGAWGPQTQARMAQSPAEGFPIGSMCDDAPDVYLASAIPTAFDRFADGASAGVSDTFEGDALEWVVEVENRGTAPADGVVITLEAPPEIAPTAYTLERASSRGVSAAPGIGGSFDGAAATIDLGSMPTAEVVTVRVTATASLYSVEADAPVPLRAYVREVAGHYQAASFGGDVTNDGSQTFGGGRLEVAGALDVYSHTRWELESDRREGMTGAGPIAVTGGALELAPHEAASAVTPLTNLTGGPESKITLRAKRSGGGGAAALVLFGDDSADLASGIRVPVDIPPDGSFHDVAVTFADAPALEGTLRRIAFVPFEQGTGASAIDWLRVEGVTVGTDSPAEPPLSDEDDEGCTCSAVGLDRSRGRGWAWLAAALAAVTVYRAVRRRAPNRRAAQPSAAAPRASA